MSGELNSQAGTYTAAQIAAGLGSANSPATYTISQLARAVSVSRQAIAQGLQHVSPTTRVEVEGKAANAWSFESIPMEWKLEITRRGIKRGFDNGERFLASLPLLPWRAPLPWDQVPQHERSKAVRLQKALARALALRADPQAPAGQTEEAGLADFRLEFRYVVSPRHWRRLLSRTVERDGGEENWQRLEIYLDERVFSERPARREVLRDEWQHRELNEVFAAVENQESPTVEDREFLWLKVLEHYEAGTEQLTDSPRGNRQRRLFKTSLIAYLSKAFPEGTLCATSESLKRRFNEKLAAWRAGGRVPDALKDHRCEESGRVGRKLCPKCRGLVVGGAVELDGDLAQTWRRLQLGKMLCPDCAEIGAYDVRRNKSEVPKSVRDDVMPDILTALQFRRGPKYVQSRSPYVRRDWSDIGPGDWAECDDVTPNEATHGLVEMEEVLAWDTDRSGRRYIGRMEVLVQIDRRTDYPWGYVIILGDPATALTPQRKATYSSVHCRLLFLHCHDRLGLPHAGGGYLLENSVWRSRLIDGPRVQHWSTSNWQHMELGLRDPRIGLNVRHALPHNARSKVIERMFFAMQNRARCHPNFLGFNERTDKRELAQDFLRRVKTGKEHPGNEVPEVSEFRRLLDTEFMAHAEEPQNGDRLPGVSPMEAFHNGIDGHPGIKERPLRQLPATARFLLSSHERLVHVSGQGIKVKAAGSEFVFLGPELEPFEHRDILARFNFEEPELLSCQPPGGEPFTMKARILPSSTATKEQLAETGRARASWTRRGKVLFDSLPHPFRATVINDSEQSEQTHKLGRFHNEEVEKFRDEKSQRKRSVRSACKNIMQAGYDPSRLRLKNPEKAGEAAARIADRWEALKRKEAERETLEAANE